MGYNIVEKERFGSRNTYFDVYYLAFSFLHVIIQGNLSYLNIFERSPIRSDRILLKMENNSEKPPDVIKRKQRSQAKNYI